MNETIFRAKDIHKSYTIGHETLKILTGASFSVNEGEMAGIVGASGAGKSTLLHIMGLLDKPDSGDLVFSGEKINFSSRIENARLRNERLGFVFQFYHLLPELNAVENVMLNPMISNSVLSWFSIKKEARETAKELLNSLGLGERLAHKPPQMSGGERQRVAIARALISEPDLLFCDEPTGNLDEKTSGAIVDLLFKINQEMNQTMVIVTHNEGFADRIPRLVRLTDGVLSEVS